MPLPEEYVQQLERDIQVMRDNLAPLLDGRMTIGHRKMGEPWVDITQIEIDRSLNTIAVYQDIVDRHRRGE